MKTQNFFKKYKPALVEALTDREKEVLFLLESCFIVSDIAKKLNLSEAGVQYHVRNIYKKLKVNSRTQLFKKLEASKAK